jgi:hypothetical protein
MNYMDYSNYTANPYYPMPPQAQNGGVAGYGSHGAGYGYDNSRSGSAGSTVAKAGGTALAVGGTVLGGVAAFKNPKAAGKLLKGGLEGGANLLKKPFKALGSLFSGAKGKVGQVAEKLNFFKKASPEVAPLHTPKSQLNGVKNMGYAPSAPVTPSVPQAPVASVASASPRKLNGSQNMGYAPATPVTPSAPKAPVVSVASSSPRKLNGSQNMGYAPATPVTPSAPKPLSVPTYIAPGLPNPYAGK